VVAIRETITD